MNEPMIQALKNWRDLNKTLHDFREDQVKEMLDHEVKFNRRKSVMERLHARFCILRAARERAEMFNAVEAVESSLL